MTRKTPVLAFSVYDIQFVRNIDELDRLDRSLKIEIRKSILTPMLCYDMHVFSRARIRNYRMENHVSILCINIISMFFFSNMILVLLK